MSLTSGFFDSVNHDRKYNTLQMSSIFDGIIRDGVFMSIADKLMVDAESGMTIVAKPGRAWFNHTWTLNDAKLPLVVEQSELILDRIDAVVLEVNSSQAVRANAIKMVKGTPSADPQKPSLTKSLDVNQYPLAYVSVKHGVTVINQVDITNAVGTSECPFVTGILETMNIDALVAQWKSEWEVWINQMKQNGEDWQEQVESEFEAWSTQQKEDFTQFVQQFEATMQIFQTNSEEAFNKWFESVKDILDDNTAGNLLNIINELKDGLPNATATYNGSVVAIVSNPITAKSIYFYAPSNFVETDTYTLNGLPLTITDLNGEPIFNAWKSGSPVSLIIKGNTGFFKSGGGGQNDTLPPMVTNLKAIGGDQSITVSWEDPISDAHDGTAITYKTESYPKHPYDGKRIDAKKNQRTVIGFLRNGTEYFVRAFPYNSKKQHQTLADGSMVTCTPNKGPALVTELKITGGGSRPTISWVNPVDDPLYHETVVVKAIDTPPVDISDGEEVYRGTGTEVTLSGLKSYTNYYFGVFAISNTGLYRGPAVSDIYRFERPGPVTNFNIEGTGGSPVLSWKNPIDDELYVATVVVRKVGSKPTEITDGTEVYRGTGESFTDSGLQSYTEYYYGVYTVGEDGRYQNPVFSERYYFEFPDEPTSYSMIEDRKNSGEFIAPEDGWFQLDAVSKSGDGGSPLGGKYWTSGGSGGSGGISRKTGIKLNKGEKIAFIFDNGDVKVNQYSITVTKGTDANKQIPGKKGTATGGDININGNDGSWGPTGSNGNSNRSPAAITKNDFGLIVKSGQGGNFVHNSPTLPTKGTDAFIRFYRGNTNIPSPSQASVLSLIPHDGEIEANWKNSGDPEQTGTTVVINQERAPETPKDGEAVDVMHAESYTASGLENGKPCYIGLFAYNADKTKYSAVKADVEIPREVTWYDTQQELEQEAQETTKQAEQAQEAVTMTRYFLPDSIAFTMPQMYDEWDPNSEEYVGKDNATPEKPAAIVRRNEKLYRCLQSHTSQENWKPETSPSLWVEIADPAIEWPEWKQPTGAHDAYDEGDKVTHNGKRYISKINGNTTEPGSDPRWWEEVS